MQNDTNHPGTAGAPVLTGPWLDGAQARLDDAITMRRRIHAHPELGLHLPVTTATVRESLQGLDVTIDSGPSTSGLVVTLRGTAPGAARGRTVLLRGDMDALPMPEDTGLPFASTQANCMHACGHDSHTAMLAGAVHLLHANRDRLQGTVKFMFQPGEEGHFGALRMIEDGLLERDGKPDGAFAIHITPNSRAGVFTSRPGPFMASTDTVEITVWGKGGHASAPHLALDPVPIACEIVNALQNMITRRINAFEPVVLTVAKIAAGTTSNVIPETAYMLGTLRALSESSRKLAKASIAQVAEKIAEAHGARAEVTLTEGYAVTVNDGRMVDLAASAARELFGAGGFQPMSTPLMGAEDWAYVLHRIPGCMFFLGVAPEGTHHHHAAPCHSNRMVLNESAMAHGIALYAGVAERFLAHGFG